VELLEAPGAAMPMACGLLEPAVIVPAAADEWDEERRRAVLLHELAHVRRHDVATHAAARAALAFYWFHPLAWLAVRELRKERERACDDLVLQSRVRASEYAAQLLEIARGFRAPAAAAWTGLAMARRSQLEGRLLAILDTGRRRAPVSRGAAAVCAALALAVVLPLAAMRPQANPPASPEELKAYNERAQAQGDYQALDRAADALSTRHQYKEAEEAASAAQVIRGKKFGVKSVEYGRGLMRLAGVERQLDKESDTLRFYQQALDILEPASGPEATELTPALSYLGYRAHKD
jgi:hypothetical protein